MYEKRWILQGHILHSTLVTIGRGKPEVTFKISAMDSRIQEPMGETQESVDADASCMFFVLIVLI